MKRKTICFLSGIMLSALLLGGCGGKKQATIKRIQSAGVLNIAVCNADHKWKTLETNEESILNSISSLLGAQGNVIFADTPEDAFAKLTSGEADIAIGALTNDTLDAYADAKGLAATETYAQSRIFVVTKRGDYSDCEAAFQDRTLAVSQELVDDKNSFATAGISTGKMTETAVENISGSLLSGSVDGYVCTRGEAEYLLSSAGGSLQAQVMTDQDPQQYVAVVADGDSQFLSGINQVMSTLSTETEAAAE